MEMSMLLWAVVLGLVQIAVAATLSTAQRGLGWNAGPRVAVPVALTGTAGRMERASHNFLETFGFFAVGVLMLTLLHRENAQSAMGAHLYFWARVIFVPTYLLGISYLRTLIWVVSTVRRATTNS